MFMIKIAVVMLSLTVLSYSRLAPLGLNLNVGINLPGKNVKNPIFIDIVDWRNAGAVTGVKNQNQWQCSSGWAFAATGALEGQHFKETQKLVSLSEQNLIDCDNQSDGCSGGTLLSAFIYVHANNGIDTEESYPYEASDGICRYNASSIGATCTGFEDVARGDELALQLAVTRIGPIAVLIDGSHSSFESYSGGIYYEPDCSTIYFNHAMLVVGYGEDVKGNEYWIVKNSYGQQWGEEGYIRMARNKNNMCGIASMASYPTV